MSDFLLEKGRGWKTSLSSDMMFRIKHNVRDSHMVLSILNYYGLKSDFGVGMFSNGGSLT